MPVGNGKRRNTEKLERNVRIKLEKNESMDGTVTAHHCELCDKYFSSKSNLERHQTNISRKKAQASSLLR